MLAAIISDAKPASRSHSTYTQPDGITFTASIRGDEWIKIRTLADGCAIVKSSDGWWCYGVYDAEGRLKNTGHRVGQPVPGDITGSSRQIPYSVLAERAAQKRAAAGKYAEARNGAMRRRTALTKAGGTTTEKCLIILAQFRDQKFTYTKSDFEKLLNTQSGSAKEYYENQFGEGWNFKFEVSSPVTLSRNLSYYGANDEEDYDMRPADMVAEACRLADSEIDFSKYDSDGDGEVDNVYVFYAGFDEAEMDDMPELIWAHQWYVGEEGGGINVSCDGKRINRYACSSELDYMENLTGIGTFCHEYGHTFGLADLYDTDYDYAGGWAAGMWSSTSIMDGGSYNNDSKTPPNFNCLEREMLGLSTPIMLEAGKTYTLDPIHKTGTCYRLDTDRDGEYYLFECRSNDGWDRYIGGKGMLVYHIDKSYSYMSKWDNNEVNASVSHQCADLVEADGRSDRINDWNDFYNDISGIFFPQSRVTAIPATGKPSLKFWSGNAPEVTISGITLSNGTIRFSVTGGTEVPEIPTVSDVTQTVFPDAAIFCFASSDPAVEATPVVRWRKSGSSNPFNKAVAVEYEKGKFACRLDRLQSGNMTYEVEITFESGGISGSSYKFSIMTKKTPPVVWPYIFISEEGAGTGLPLHVVGAADAEQIIWKYNEEEISADKDFRYRPIEDGTLKAEIIWNDGSKDIIIKVLKVDKQ